MSALILDAGALIAIDRGDRQVLAQRAGELLGRARLRRLCDAAGNKAVAVDC